MSEYYKLDTSYSFILPSLTINAMLKFTNINLKLLNDYDMYLFIEKCIRGGMSNCINLHLLIGIIR